ncbi:DUF6526 family protein [Paenibacillus hamazuiensis]|uniref:DUF6526 family protein n=1 Tax=Paenibacillus hamazuiensis TaxID=2936508 RepID=UPI00200E4146|nr:DUF6526 family protein [Paenibacillus hamazuiensis]
MSQPSQNYANHRQLVPIYHFVLIPLSLIAAILSIVYAVSGFAANGALVSILVLLLGVVCLVGTFMGRVYAIKVQDRLIRTEEDIRHFKLTGRWIDPRLTIKQLIALRFAGDAEFPALCEKALKENMSPDAIKKAVKDWRGDYYRV